MTEKEYLTCADPLPLLEHLGKQTSARKARLLACGCSRRLWQFLSPEGKHSLEVAEKFADRQATAEELRLAMASYLSAIRADNCASFAARPSQSFRRKHLRHALVHAAWSQGWSGLVTKVNVKWEAAEKAAQADLVRDVFGNPFRPAKIERRWLTWNDRTLTRMAQAAYEERNFDRLPILGDALEEAGCTDADILTHCRAMKSHCRGCWVVDGLLRKA